jgi:YHS domain-containing protein
VSLVDDGERVRGSIFHASEYQGRLFLFADAQRKSAFKANPERYAMVDVAAAGACVVIQKDEGRTVPGQAKFAAWHAGLVYRFTGLAEKKKFLGAPEQYAVENKPSANDSAIDKVPAADAAADAVPQSAVAQ